MPICWINRYMQIDALAGKAMNQKWNTTFGKNGMSWGMELPNKDLEEPLIAAMSYRFLILC